MWKAIISFPSSSRLNNRFHWLLWSVLHSVFFFAPFVVQKPTKITPDCCTLLLVTKYECVSLRPAWDPQPWLPIPWQGGRKNGWDSTHSWSRCHFKPKPGYTTAALLPPSFLQPVMGELQPCEQNKTGCAAVTELALLLTLWDRVNGTLCVCWVSSASASGLSAGSLDSAQHAYMRSHVSGKRPDNNCELGEPNSAKHAELL